MIRIENTDVMGWEAAINENRADGNHGIPEIEIMLPRDGHRQSIRHDRRPPFRILE